jgi:hypothetical protein
MEERKNAERFPLKKSERLREFGRTGGRWKNI